MTGFYIPCGNKWQYGDGVGNITEEKSRNQEFSPNLNALVAISKGL